MAPSPPLLDKKIGHAKAAQANPTLGLAAKGLPVAESHSPTDRGRKINMSSHRSAAPQSSRISPGSQRPAKPAGKQSQLSRRGVSGLPPLGEEPAPADASLTKDGSANVPLAVSSVPDAAFRPSHSKVIAAKPELGLGMRRVNATSELQSGAETATNRGKPSTRTMQSSQRATGKLNSKQTQSSRRSALPADEGAPPPSRRAAKGASDDASSEAAAAAALTATEGVGSSSKDRDAPPREDRALGGAAAEQGSRVAEVKAAAASNGSIRSPESLRSRVDQSNVDEVEATIMLASKMLVVRASVELTSAETGKLSAGVDGGRSAAEHATLTKVVIWRTLSPHACEPCTLQMHPQPCMRPPYRPFTIAPQARLCESLRE